MSTILKDVKKTFGNFQALKGIDLTIGDGEFVAIVGPSGCGKTTLLRLIAGFEEPTAGQIYMHDELIASATTCVAPEKRNLGMVFQAFALWPHMKVKEQVAFPLKYHRFAEASLKENKAKRVEEMLMLVGLQDFAERMPGDLSGGQKQRVAIARALAPSPALLLMDEPLSSLDAKLRIELRNEIQTIHRKTNTSIVYVTHDQSEALAMADKIVVMNNGTIEQVGTPKEIYFTPRTEFVARFIGKANVLKGRWHENYFYPLEKEDVKWQVPNVTDSMKMQSICPIRPEQLSLSKSGNGLSGVVRNVLFQGRETHFTVDIGTALIDIVESIDASFQVGDQVIVHPKEQKSKLM